MVFSEPPRLIVRLFEDQLNLKGRGLYLLLIADETCCRAQESRDSMLVMEL